MGGNEWEALLGDVSGTWDKVFKVRSKKENVVLDKKGKEAPSNLCRVGMGEHSPGFCPGRGKDRQRGLS